MRRPLRLTSSLASAALVCTGALALATTASAQSAGETRGLRYLSWSGRTQPATAAPGPSAPAPAATTRRDLRRPNMVIPHGGFAAVEEASRPGAPTTAGAARSTLTPANAWMRPPAPAPAPVSAPMPAPSPAPVPAPVPQPARSATPQARATPDYLPDQGGRGQSIPAEALFSPPAAAPVPSAGPVDPMAPRRDAPIFRMQRDAPAPQPGTPRPAASAVIEPPPRATRVVEVANSGERPPQQGARYYSVHRQIGRQPDALEMPEPGYVDGLAIGEIETLASQDLAAPEQGPALIRDADGRVRAQPAASDGDHQ